jgi:hypothetical protein
MPGSEITGTTEQSSELARAVVMIDVQPLVRDAPTRLAATLNLGVPRERSSRIDSETPRRRAHAQP